MKQLLFASLSFIIGISFSQNLELPTIKSNLENVLMTKKGIQKTQSCGSDTVYYTDAKATNQSTKIAFTTGNSSTGFVQAYSQKFGGVSNLTVSGFRWYGRSYDPNQATNPIVNVICEMYALDANGLPTGTPMASETITVDTSSSNMQHNVVFSTPVTTSSAYAIVVKNMQQDQLFILSNDEQTHDGNNENLCGVFYEPLGQWRIANNLFGNGDFDMLFLPFVNYTVNTSFSTPTSGCQNISSTFTNTSSNHFNSKFYNVDKFTSSALQYDWNYGDGNSSNNQLNGSNTYLSAGTYTITLTSTINGWTMNCTDSYTTSFQIFPTPTDPTSTPPTPVCEYTPIGNLTASGGSGTYKWYDDSISNQLGSGNPFNCTIQLPDTIYVTNTENGCESSGTPVVLSFLSNPIPTFTVIDQGAGTYDFTGAPSATTYAWDFGDGNVSSIQTPSNTYTGQGSFTVCLDANYSNGCQNQYCETITIVSVEEKNITKFKVYPNPIVASLNLSFKEEMCTISVLDINGKMLHSTKGNNQTIIDFSTYSSGIYFVKIKEKSGYQETVKVIKK